MRHGRAVVVGSVVLGATFTLVVTLAPVVRLAYANVRLHVALNTGEALVASLLAYLSIGRFGELRRLRDLLLSAAFVTFAVVNLMLSATGTASSDDFALGFVIWASVFGRVVAAGAFAAAALVGPDRLVTARVLRVWTAVAIALAAGLAALAMVAELNLAEILDPELSPESAGRPRIVGHPLALALQVALLGLFATAAIGFLRRTTAERDELLFWFGAGAILRAFAQLNYFLFPSLYSEWVYTGDLLRLGSYVFFVIGGARELRGFWRVQTEVAVLGERQRLAREIHDGLSQELSFLQSQLASSHPPGPEMAVHLRDAATRALTESRRVVAALVDVAGADLAWSLRAEAEDVARRSRATVGVEVDPDAPVRADSHAELARIVREATTNAVRHGGAREVQVRLERAGDGARLLISDDGSGFDPTTPPTGFGLRSMADRAALLGGEIRIHTAPGAGTVIEVVLPGQ